MRRGMPLTTGDSSGRLRNDDGFNGWLRRQQQQHRRQRSHPSQSKPSPPAPQHPLPPPTQTQVGRWQHANPAPAGPLQCQFPPPGYMPLLIPCPGQPCAHPPCLGLGGERVGVRGQLEVWMELARSDDITNLGDEMVWGGGRLQGGG